MYRKLGIVFILLFTVSIYFFQKDGYFINVDASSQEVEEKINTYREQMENLIDETDSTNEELEKLKEEISELDGELVQLDEQMSETNVNIRKKEVIITDTRQRVNDIQVEITNQKQRIVERDELLKDRVRSMYKNGSAVSYLEVIFGANSFGDFIERVIALNSIAQQDQNILEQHINDKSGLEKNQQTIETELLNVEENLKNLELMKEELESQQGEKNRLLNSLVEIQGSLEDQVMTMEEEKAIIEAQEEAAKQELKQLEEEKAQRNQSLSQNAPVESNGMLLRPATGTISTGFEMRWGQMHYGIDIGKNGRTEDVPVVAAESGTVIRSYYSTSYGNTVLIRHTINGETITTLYAHMENRAVAAGDQVSRGEFLGYMGNTGRSFGPHLHFEVHEGNWNVNKSNAVNPMEYIE